MKLRHCIDFLLKGVFMKGGSQLKDEHFDISSTSGYSCYVLSYTNQQDREKKHFLNLIG